MKSFFLLFLLFVSFLQADNPSLQINICSYRNGVGLNQDIDLLMEELTKLGHSVEFVNYYDLTPRPIVDINIFVEVVNAHLFQNAKENYVIPNPEWYKFNYDEIPSFDKILCKTKNALEIFTPLNPNSVYLSFTCKDRYDPLITKDYKLALHLAGQSIQKNTNEVASAWQHNPHLPFLTVIKHAYSWDFPSISNLNLIYQYLSNEEITLYLNSHGLHICPSGMEGFGHYIMEGMSCGAVVVTLDAPPMHEFVQDKRCLIKFSSRRPHNLGTMHYCNPQAIAETVERLLSLSEEELKEIGENNRNFYLKNDRIFKKNLAKIFPPASSN